MRKRVLHVLPLVLTLAVVGCSNEDLNSEDSSIYVGEDVQFGVSLTGDNTRTIYGNETTTGFPIYWVDGDKVLVASPQCSQVAAEYMVTAATTTQDYADKLTKTGDGLQWGTEEKASFYSIYPCSENTSLSVDDEGNVNATLYVDATQYAKYETKTDASDTYYYAEPADMENVVMYAQTLNVENGKTVDLQYIPYSTVVEFEINAPVTYTESEEPSIVVQSITFNAPDGISIAGAFTFEFPEGDNSPSITSNSGNQSITVYVVDDNGECTATLSPDMNCLRVKMCVIPIDVTDLHNWSLDIDTNVGTFNGTMYGNTSWGWQGGKVLKVILPDLSYASKPTIVFTNEDSSSEGNQRSEGEYDVYDSSYGDILTRKSSWDTDW